MGKKIKEALHEAASFLKDCKVEGPRGEAELLLAFLLQVERPYLYAHGELELQPGQLERYASLCRRRGRGEPLAYLRGEKEFWGRLFYVEPGVFIPRPETEHLVEGVLQWARETAGVPDGQGPGIIDLGTGSGCIAVSLALELPRSRVTAVDREDKALALARRNSRRHGVAPRITFLQGHFFQALGKKAAGEERFHIIVSNPPYVEAGSLASLPRELGYEPRLALDGGPDGLRAYREIIGAAERHLLSPGLLALEVGAGQAPQVEALARSAGFRLLKIINDYAGIARVVLFTF